MARRRTAAPPPRKFVQFAVALDNTAGTLGALCATLRKARVNIEALSVSDNTDCGWIRLVATPAPRARAALAKAGLTVCAQLVLGIEAEDKPGELERICRALSRAGVNVNYVYGSTVRGATSRLFMGVSDVEQAMGAVSAAG